MAPSLLDDNSPVLVLVDGFIVCRFVLELGEPSLAASARQFNEGFVVNLGFIHSNYHSTLP